MKIVINASPLIFLTKLELIDHIVPLFEMFVITTGVKEEILKHNDETSNWINSTKQSTIRLGEVGEIPSIIKAWDLGKGESEVIAFAKMNRRFIAALDDKAARNCAYSMKIKVMGTLGLILLAKHQGTIDNATKYLHQLLNLGYRIDEETFQYAIKLANE
jgi:predicted nucleic acid-binding protein